MIELEPVGEHRVFVPTSGDVLAFCPDCGKQVGQYTGMSALVREDIMALAKGSSISCCGNTEPALREVP